MLASYGAEIPFVFGLSVPPQLSPQFQSSELANVLLERAVERGFDFLLAPQNIARAFVQADASVHVLQRTRMQALCDRSDTGSRELIWLGQAILAAEGSLIVSISEIDCGLSYATILRQQIDALRGASEKHENRRILLEIKISGVSEGTSTEEDDLLESFMMSLGKKGLPTVRVDTGSKAKQKTDCEGLYRLLMFARNIGFDGVSLAIPNPFGELPLIQKHLVHSMSAH